MPDRRRHIAEGPVRRNGGLFIGKEKGVGVHMKRIRRLLTTALAVGALTLAATISASACTTLYVGGNLTEEGTPFVARTEDYGADMNKLWMIAEAGKWKAGDTYTSCSAYGALEWTFTHDSYRFTHFTNDVFYDTCPECGENVTTGNPEDFHYSYTEFGTNEKGVSVSATETISGNQSVLAVDPMVKTGEKGGGIEETDIPTIILAEADSARDGVELLCNIYDTYGAFFASGLFICDQNETWYIENCTGTQYLAVKLNDDMLFIEPNISILGEIDLDDTDNVIASDRLIEVAKQAGTFVGDESKNIIDYKASYATNSSGNARMPDGLKFLNPEKYGDMDSDYLNENNEIFTISNVKDGETVSLYTNIQADRALDKNDVFDFYKLSSVGKESNQEIEIFQLFKDQPLETGTVGWVGVGNMSNNVFVPYYPLLLTDQYEGYQVSTPVVTKTSEKPDSFCTWTTRNGGQYVVYPENWRDSYYFTFEGLGGYIKYAEQITGQPVSDADKQYVLDQLDALQQQFNAEFAAMDPQDTTEVGMDMAQRAHEKGLELIDYLLSKAPQSPFQDVATNSWYFQAVNYVQEKGIMSGVSQNIFAPDATLTRAMVAQMLYSLEGKPQAGTPAFTDVAANAWYAKAAAWANEKGLITGMGNNTFAPDSPLTREQLALILKNYAQMKGYTTADQGIDLKDYADYAGISSWALGGMDWAVNAGLISGKGENTLAPTDNTTRAEVATIMMQFMEKL